MFVCPIVLLLLACGVDQTNRSKESRGVLKHCMDDLEREVELIDDIPKVQWRKKPKLSLGMQVNGEIQASLLFMWHTAFVQTFDSLKTVSAFLS